jgi:hypothetical protein
MARKPFKKDLTPLRKGGQVDTHVGKGATEQRRGPSGSEYLTGGSPEQSAANQYPKPSPEAESPAEGAAEQEEEPPVPVGKAPPRMPTALMPGGGGNDDEAA